jgi:hypothetical protein
MKRSLISLVFIVIGIFVSLVVFSPVVEAAEHTFEAAEVITYSDLSYTSTYNTVSTYVGGFSEYTYLAQDGKRPVWLWLNDGIVATSGPLTSYVQFGTSSAFTTTVSGGSITDVPMMVSVPDGYNYVRVYTALFVPSGQSASDTWNGFYISNSVELYGFTAGIIVDNYVINELFDGYYNQGYDKGYEEGYDYFDQFESDDIYDDGYSDGYSDGIAQGMDDILAIRNMIPGILGVIFAFFFTLSTINVLGISILNIIVAMASIAIGLAIFKLFFK